MNKFKKNNKGFSLVELIVVIAIMAVLAVAVALAVTKFIPESKRSTDITNARSIQSAVLVDSADTTVSWSAFSSSTELTAANLPANSSLKSVPGVQGITGGKWMVQYTESTNTCVVLLSDGTNSKDLTVQANADAYKSTGSLS